ncbi:uncharacterized protein ColSpa_03538 [Colletotrichum spaethianum]|uniref:Uncharacterized protein n=1 Tax=Colletotrichum spaethianum TaxID=700344 RepID=A0AA37NVK3_9PEZI|nr:uncharacterized protein ColSpa_03538 [Colletotrichum spaethianum]GKT43357.1 hypothetical protein ColSpa_03538 [Colletotrichum spaethianum]
MTRKRTHAKRAPTKNVRFNQGEDGDADIDTSPAKSRTRAPKPRSRKRAASPSNRVQHQATVTAQTIGPALLPYSAEGGAQKTDLMAVGRVEINFLEHEK